MGIIITFYLKAFIRERIIKLFKFIKVKYVSVHLKAFIAAVRI